MPSICPHCFVANFEQAATCLQCGAQMPTRRKGTGSFTKLARFTEIPQTPLPSMLSKSEDEEDALALPVSDPMLIVSNIPGIVARKTVAPLPQPDPQPRPMPHKQVQKLQLRPVLAGHGSIITHHSWFLTSQTGHRMEAGRVYTLLEEEARHRDLDDIQVACMHGRSGQPAYIQLQRQDASVFLSLTSLAEHLYISRTTTLRLPVSLFRCLAFVALTLFVIIAPFSAPSFVSLFAQSSWLSALVSPSPSNSFLSNWLLTGLFDLLSLLIYIPVLCLFLVCLLRFLLAWRQQRDPLALLRSRHIQLSQRDNAALLEHLANDIVRSTARHLGIDASESLLVTASHQASQRFHLV